MKKELKPLNHQPCRLNFSITNVTLIGIPVITSYLVTMNFLSSGKKYKTSVIHGTMDNKLYTGKQLNPLFFSKQIQKQNKLQLFLVRLNEFKLQQVMCKTTLDIGEACKDGQERSIFFYSENRMKIAELVYTLQCMIDHALQIQQSDQSNKLQCVFQSKNQSQTQKKSQALTLKQSAKIQTEEDLRYKNFTQSQYQSSGVQKSRVKQQQQKQLLIQKQKERQRQREAEIERQKERQKEREMQRKIQREKQKQEKEKILTQKQAKLKELDQSNKEVSCLTRWFQKKFNKPSLNQQRAIKAELMKSQIKIIKQISKQAETIQLKLFKLKTQIFLRRELARYVFIPRIIKLYYIQQPNNQQEMFAQISLKNNNTENVKQTIQYFFPDLKLKVQKKKMIEIKVILQKVDSFYLKNDESFTNQKEVFPKNKQQDQLIITQGILIQQDLKNYTQNQITLFDTQGQKFATFFVKIQPEMVQFQMQSLPYLQENPQVQNQIPQYNVNEISIKKQLSINKLQNQQTKSIKRRNSIKINQANPKIKKKQFNYEDTEQEKQKQKCLSPKSKQFAQDQYKLKFNQISSSSFRIGPSSQPRQMIQKMKSESPQLIRSNTQNLPNTNIKLDSNLSNVMINKKQNSPMNRFDTSTIKANHRQYKKCFVSNIYNQSISPSVINKSVNTINSPQRKYQNSISSNQVSSFNVFGQNLSSTSTFAKNKGNTSNFVQINNKKLTQQKNRNHQVTSPQQRQQKDNRNLFNISIQSMKVILYQSDTQKQERGKYLKLKNSRKQKYQTSILTKNLIWNEEQYIFMGMNLKDHLQICLFQYSKDLSTENATSLLGSLKIQMKSLMKSLKVKYFRGDITNKNGQIIATIIINFSIHIDIFNGNSSGNQAKMKNKKSKRQTRTKLRLQQDDMYNYYNQKINYSPIKQDHQSEYSNIVKEFKKKNRNNKTQITEGIRSRQNTNGSFLPQIQNRQRNLSWNSKGTYKEYQQPAPYQGGKNIKIGRQERFNTLNIAQMKDM